MLSTISAMILLIFSLNLTLGFIRGLPGVSDGDHKRKDIKERNIKAIVEGRLKTKNLDKKEHKIYVVKETAQHTRLLFECMPWVNALNIE